MSKRRNLDNQRNMNKIRICISLIMISIVLALSFTVMKQQKKIQDIDNVKTQQYSRKAKIDKEIKTLTEDFENLDDPELIEKYARERLGMVKPNEILVKDKTSKPKDNQNYTPSPTLDKNKTDK